MLIISDIGTIKNKIKPNQTIKVINFCCLTSGLHISDSLKPSMSGSDPTPLANGIARMALVSHMRLFILKARIKSFVSFCA